METYSPRHRAAGTVLTRPARHDFRPRHCSGEGCLHNHAGRSFPLRGVMRLFKAVA